MKRITGLMLFLALAATTIMGSASCYTHPSAKAPPDDVIMLSTFVEHATFDAVSLDQAEIPVLPIEVHQAYTASAIHCAGVLPETATSQAASTLQKRRCAKESNGNKFLNIEKYYS